MKENINLNVFLSWLANCGLLLEYWKKVEDTIPAGFLGSFLGKMNAGDSITLFSPFITEEKWFRIYKKYNTFLENNHGKRQD